MIQGGVVHPYSEVSLPSQGGKVETFPINIRPGVTVQPYDADPVWVLSRNGSPAIFQLEGRPAGAGSDTVLSNLVVAGGDQGILIDGSTGGFFDAHLQGLKLLWNTVSCSATADAGAVIDMDIDDCQIRDDDASTWISNPPAPTIGLRFHALESSGSPGVIHARISNLDTVGQFSLMAPAPFLGGLPAADLAYPHANASRLVEVHAAGTSAEFPQAPNDYRPALVATVELEVTGGDWQGAFTGTDGEGWDLGLYASTAPASFGTPNFAARYDVTLTGVSMQGFGLAGAYATVAPNTRGRLDLQGGTAILSTGNGIASPISTFHHSGLHAYNDQGYLEVEADGLVSAGNIGSGVFLNTPSTLANDPPVPMGTWLSLEDCRLHQNAREGLRIRCGHEWTNNPGHATQAIAGGTWDNYDMAQGELSFIDYGYEPFFIEAGIRSGQGRVNRCAISNNSLHGVLLELRGNSDPGSNNYAAIPVRFTNDFIWNNGAGEFHAETETANSPAGNGPYLLAPIVHCTMVGPENGNAYTFDISESLPGSTMYSRGEVQIIGGAKYLRNRIYNTIFQRGPASGANEDYSPLLSSRLVFDDLNTTVPASKIGVSGIRSKPTIQGDSKSTSTPTPWVGPIVMSSVYPTGFSLNAQPNSVFLESNPWITADVPDGEFNYDYLQDQRPSDLAEHDKGAKEQL
ncbi:MAG: hypothetical protein D6702_12490 [Planctomycetota bacterium]|nr:MAG: hypothetical protein D6702_12490 [Planctomycetota bacterium]